MKISTGTTRLVIIIKNLAFKFPNPINSWENFLLGFLANMHEVRFSTINHPRLAEVKFHIPGGWLVVMPRADVVDTDEDLVKWDIIVSEDNDREMLSLIVERKKDSIGWINGNLQAIDYGS